MAAPARVGHLLDDVPTKPYEKALSRWVNQASIDKYVEEQMQLLLLEAAGGGLPKISRATFRADYLFTSGNAGRCNPAGVDALYFAEDSATAEAERKRYHVGVERLQPAQRYHGRLQIRHLLDLSEPTTLRHLHLCEDDLFAAWFGASSSTQLQELGAAVSQQFRIGAIRFPSDACREIGQRGFNLAIFKAALTSPDSFVILGPGGQSLQSWPAADGNPRG